MQDNEIRKYNMLVRVRDFGEAHADSFVATSLGGRKLAALAAVVLELEASGAEQSGGDGAARAGTLAKRTARDDLRGKMIAIRETARALEEVLPGVSAKFRIPRDNGDQALINGARAFVEEATPIKAHFLEREMPATFLEDLTAAIDTFEEAVTAKNDQTERRIAATAAIKNALERGQRLVRELSPIVRNKFRNNPQTLAAWESASRVPAAPRRSPTKQPPATAGD